MEGKVNVPDVTPELPAWSWRAILALIGRLPQGAVSRGMGRIADIPLPRGLRRPVLGTFARALRIDLSEAELPLEEYGSLNAFFVRRLKPGARVWPSDPATAASPVDGIIGQFGLLAEGRMLQAKGQWYTAVELLADEAEAGRYRDGAYVTIYLSPRHYHRIHTPTAGEVRRADYIPGSLLPVNAPAVASVPKLFARNERLITYVDGPLGRVAVVAVGAFNVGRISAAYDPEWRAAPGANRWATNRPGGERATKRYDPPHSVSTGEEIMAFHLGSTVVLLFEGGKVRLDPGLAPGVEVKVGEAIARSAAR